MVGGLAATVVLSVLHVRFLCRKVNTLTLGNQVLHLIIVKGLAVPVVLSLVHVRFLCMVLSTLWTGLHHGRIGGVFCVTCLEMLEKLQMNLEGS